MTGVAFDSVHISTIRAGDTVEHNGKVQTVCARDLTRISGMGRALFGDTYRLGREPVRRVKIERALPVLADPESVPVLFRAERSGDCAGEVTAVFPTLPGTDDSDVTVYARVGQHSTGTRGWYQETRPATDAEAEPLRRELLAIGYKLEPVKRWTRYHDATRSAAYHASRGVRA